MKEFLLNSEKNPNTVSKKIIDLRVTALVPSSIKMVGAFIIFMFIKIMVENSYDVYVCNSKSDDSDSQVVYGYWQCPIE